MCDRRADDSRRRDESKGTTGGCCDCAVAAAGCNAPDYCSEEQAPIYGSWVPYRGFFRL
jgi:hypothetical protein